MVELGVGDVPTILFETRTEVPEARLFPLGVGTPDVYEMLLLSGEGITLSDVLEVVSRAHSTALVTPTVQSKVGKLWKKQTKYWVSRDAEDLIQLYLRMALTGAFPSCLVRAEQSQATGRLDLEIEEADRLDPSSVVRHAILELKVLRRFGSTGDPVSATETKKWIRDGVIQAAAYRDERQARASALCCFDMRGPNANEPCFSHVVRLAKRLRVVLRAWTIHASAKAYREYRVVGATKSAS